MRIWLIVRWILIVASAVSAFLVPLGAQAKPPIGWGELLLILAFCPIGLLFVFWVQANNPRSAKLWLRPSWQLNPFNFRQPLQFFHLSVYAFLSMGLVMLVRLAVSQVPFYVEVLAPIVMAVGILFGLQLVMLVFAAKMERDMG
jgi:hypothetical protein